MKSEKSLYCGPSFRTSLSRAFGRVASHHRHLPMWCLRCQSEVHERRLNLTGSTISLPSAARKPIASKRPKGMLFPELREYLWDTLQIAEDGAELLSVPIDLAEPSCAPGSNGIPIGASTPLPPVFPCFRLPCPSDHRSNDEMVTMTATLTARVDVECPQQRREQVGGRRNLAMKCVASVRLADSYVVCRSHPMPRLLVNAIVRLPPPVDSGLPPRRSQPLVRCHVGR